MGAVPIPGRVVAALRCPVCGIGLVADAGSLCCAAGHRFDLARHGYVNLSRSAVRGDTAQMAAARAAFLDAGHYAPLADLLGELAAAAQVADGVVLDAGAGTGYYLATILDRAPQAVGLAVDSSKYAVRRAARAHDRIGAVVADVWRALPVRDGSVGMVLDVFAPRNAREFHRVLWPGGWLVVVTPTPRHLAELVEVAGLLGVDAAKDERLERDLSPYFDFAQRDQLQIDLTLDAADAERLVGMGPSAWHIDLAEVRSRIASVPGPVRATASVVVSMYRPARG